MKISFNGYKIKFKKKHAPAMLRWLSGLVHALAAVKANADQADLEQPDLMANSPSYADVYDADGNAQDHIWVLPECLDDLKAARRAVYAVSISGDES